MKTMLENLIFNNRRLVIAIFIILTIFMMYEASHLKIDAGFAKLIPLKHEYIKTYVEYRDQFGGANRVVIAIKAREGDIFTPRFFEVLAELTDDVFFIEGVDRTRVMSLFTPNVRFTEVVEDGISGGNVIPDDFEPTPEGLAKVRENILKSNYMGRLVANDFSSAIVVAELLEVNPTTGEKLDYIDVAGLLEGVREKYSNHEIGVEFDYHIIGFAKVIGDIASGAARVVLFFLIAFTITAVFVYVYSQSLKLTMIVLGCALVAVIWQLGLLTLLGFGIDPMSILVPFLIFAIAVSHGVQMISAFRAEVFDGADSLTASRSTFRRLLVPGGIALLSDTIGFITIMLIEIRMIQEMAITASLGVAVIILTDLILVPVLLSYVQLTASYQEKLHERATKMDQLWSVLGGVTVPRNAAIILAVAAVLFAVGGWKAGQIKIGDLHAGVPELRADSQYNIDTDFITKHFSIGVDVITTIVESHPEACTEHDVMTTIDRFEWHMRNVPGVQSVFGIGVVAKIINAGWNEGSLKWRVLPRNPSTMAQAVTYIDTATGLLNAECSVMPVYIYTVDHKAETIERIVAEVKAYQAEHGSEDVTFRLATGNVGVMAATNEVVSEAQFPILLWVFAAIIVLCLITFRSVKGTMCIVIPLALVSVLAYALMAILEIGLKTSTLPVVALGVGIGVDYGIYIYSRFRSLLQEGQSIHDAYLATLKLTGSGVIFTGITLAIGVATWIFAPIKFQADMGILLTFMFLVNMLGAIILLPALACYLKPKG
ncbi:MAG: RND family transporter [Acidobacteria bacterium]|nr:RND family transporter [Candidatus Sulfomarinibacter sp. MAG AM1]